MKKKSVYIDLGVCIECGGCIDLAPDIFYFNESAGIMEVIDSIDNIDIELVEEAMKNCPKKCIFWEIY